MNTSQDGFGSYLIYFPNPNNLTSKGGVGFLKTKSTSISNYCAICEIMSQKLLVCLISSSNFKFQIHLVPFFIRLNSTSRQKFQIPILQVTRNP